MKQRSAIRSASRAFLLIASLAGGSCVAHDLTITGVMKTESGVLVKGATIIVYEYVGRLAQMPDVKIRAVRVTDRDAAFSIKLDNVRGDLNLQVVRDHCEWKDETVRVPLSAIKGAGNHVVNIVPRDDRC